MEIFTINNIKYIIKTALKRFKGCGGMQTAAALAYFLSLSLFPFLIILNTLLFRLNLPEETANSFLYVLFPKNVYEIIILQNESFSAVGAQTYIGALFTLYGASKAIRILNRAFFCAYKIDGFYSYIKSVLYSVFITVSLAALAIFSAAAAAFLSESVNIAVKKTSFAFLLAPFSKVFSTLALLILSVFILTFIHHIALRGKIKFTNLILGSFISICAVFSGSAVFALYFNNFSNLNAIYGTLETAVLLLLWLYLFSLFIIVGAYINSAVLSLKDQLCKSG